MHGRDEGPHLSAPVNCLATRSRLALPLKWKSQPRRSEEGVVVKEEPSEEPSSSTFFSGDYSGDAASCSLQLCFQLCLVGLVGAYGKGSSGPFLGHVD